MIFNYPRETRTRNGLPATVFSFELFLLDKLVKGENIPKTLLTKIGLDLVLPVVEVNYPTLKDGACPNAKATRELTRNVRLVHRRTVPCAEFIPAQKGMVSLGGIR
jgi:hypothetical protein